MKLLGIIGTQEIAVLLTFLMPLAFVIVIPVWAYKAGLKRGRKEGRLQPSGTKQV